MHHKSSATGIVLCMIGFIMFGLFFGLQSFIGYFYFPIFPGIFIYIMIIIVAVVSIENSKARNKAYSNNIYHNIPSVRNPYIIQNAKPIEVKDDTEKVIHAQYCQYCGVKIEREARFCHNCGTNLLE
ncbi:MAG: zinc ribbon domain-containing protein [Candidatus Hodarchaeota archaeon]